MILENLAYHAPRFVVLLDQANPDAGVSDLERAGIVKLLYQFQGDCFKTKLALELTEQGQRIAASRGWAVDQNILTIPLGRFTYVKNSYLIRRSDYGPYAITFRYRYDGNFNVPFLLKFGKATDWNTGNKSSLTDVGNTFKRTVWLRYGSGKGWWLDNAWYKHPSLIVETIVVAMNVLLSAIVLSLLSPVSILMASAETAQWQKGAVFAAAAATGVVKCSLLPAVIHYRAGLLSAQRKGMGCRDYAYGNGDRGLLLVAWVSIVDFANGMSWHAPPMSQIQPFILDAFSKHR